MELRLLFGEVDENMYPYGAPKHRHLGEIEQELARASFGPLAEDEVEPTPEDIAMQTIVRANAQAELLSEPAPIRVSGAAGVER